MTRSNTQGVLPLIPITGLWIVGSAGARNFSGLGTRKPRHAAPVLFRAVGRAQQPALTGSPFRFALQPFSAGVAVGTALIFQTNCWLSASGTLPIRAKFPAHRANPRGR